MKLSFTKPVKKDNRKEDNRKKDNRKEDDRKEIIFLGLILVLAFALRFFKLGQVPVALFGDEMDIGYQAYSVWKTGKDYLGNFAPVYFNSFYEYRMPLLVYLTAPLAGVFGLSEMTVRFLPAFFGVIDIFLFWLLVKRVTRGKATSLFAAFLLAVSPWQIHFSRAGFDVTLMLALVLGAVIALWESKREPRFLFLFAVFASLSFYAYSTAVVFGVIFYPLVFFFLWREKVRKEWKKVIFPGVVFFLLLLPFLGGVFSSQAGSRFSGINITSDPKIIDQIIFKRSQDNGGGRFYHNKLVSYGKAFVANYLSSFSPQFLFLSGDPNPRQSSGKGGQLFLIFLPLFLWGVTFSLRERKTLGEKLFLGWLFLAPVPASLTIDGGSHATRLFLLLPPLLFFTAQGGVGLSRLFGSKSIFFAAVFFLILGAELSLYLHQYYSHYRRESWQYFDFGVKEAMEKIKEVEGDYDLIIINGKHNPPLGPFLFWTNADPRWFQENYQGQEWKKEIIPGVEGFRLGKYVFGYPEGNVTGIISPKVLYLAYQNDEIPGDWDWEKSPPLGIKSILQIKEPVLETPYLYLITGDEGNEGNERK